MELKELRAEATKIDRLIKGPEIPGVIFNREFSRLATNAIKMTELARTLEKNSSRYTEIFRWSHKMHESLLRVSQGMNFSGILGDLEKVAILRNETFHQHQEIFKIASASSAILNEGLAAKMAALFSDQSVYLGSALKFKFPEYPEIFDKLLDDSDFSLEEEDSLLEGKINNDSENHDSLLTLPNEILGRLRRVKFLPITLLGDVLKNPELMKGIKPREFEMLIADLLDLDGYADIELTPRSKDGGRDVLATGRLSGIPIFLSFECKQSKNKIGLEKMRTLLGSVSYHKTRATKGVLATTSQFTEDAVEFMMSEPRIGGKSFEDLVKWIHELKS